MRSMADKKRGRPQPLTCQNGPGTSLSLLGLVGGHVGNGLAHTGQRQIAGTGAQSGHQARAGLKAGADMLHAGGRHLLGCCVRHLTERRAKRPQVTQTDAVTVRQTVKNLLLERREHRLDVMLGHSARLRDAVGNVIQVHWRNGSNLGEILDATVGKVLVVGYILLNHKTCVF